MSIIKYLEESRSHTDWSKLILDLVWLLESNLGSKIYRKKLNENNRGKYLNLGCGGDTFDGWINADYYKLHRIIRGLDDWPDWMLDATKSWNCPDNFFGGIYCEHTIEHIHYDKIVKFFEESYRTLQSGKYLRIVVPDLNKYVNYYNNNQSLDEKFCDFPGGAIAMHSLTQKFCHVSVWDEYLLAEVLSEIGFVNIKKVDFQKGSAPELLKDSMKNKWESLYVEAQKPAI
jgi:predicted SAM-dependent methyltransferase